MPYQYNIDELTGINAAYNDPKIKRLKSLNEKTAALQSQLIAVNFRAYAIALQISFEIFQAHGWGQEQKAGYQNAVTMIQAQLTAAFGAVGKSAGDSNYKRAFLSMDQNTKWAEKWLAFFAGSPLCEYLPEKNIWLGLRDYFPKKYPRQIEIKKAARVGRARVLRSKDYELATLTFPDKSASDTRPYITYYALTEAGYYDAMIPLKRQIDRASKKLKTKKEVKDWFEEQKQRIDKLLKLGWSPFLPDHLQPEELRKTKVSHKLLIDALMKAYDFKLRQYPKQADNYRHQFLPFLEWLKMTGRDSAIVGENPKKGETAFITADALEFINYIRKTRGLEGNSLNSFVNITRGMFSHLVKGELRQKNPFSGLNVETTDTAGHVPYTKKEGNEIFAYLENHHLSGLLAMCKMIYYGFLRPAELIQIHAGLIDLQGNEIFIPGEISKTNKSKTITITPAFKKALLNYGVDKMKDGELLFVKYTLPNAQTVYRPENWNPSVLELQLLLPNGSKNRTWAEIQKLSISKKQILRKSDGVIDKYNHLIKTKFGIGKEKGLYTWKHTGAIAASLNGFAVPWIKDQAGHTTLEHTTTYLSKFPRKVKNAIYNVWDKVDVA